MRGREGSVSWGWLLRLLAGRRGQPELTAVAGVDPSMVRDRVLALRVSCEGEGDGGKVRASAEEDLKRLAGPDATAVARYIVPMLRDQAPEVRQAAAVALGLVGGRSAVKPLFKLIRGPRPLHDVDAALKAILDREIRSVPTGLLWKIYESIVGKGLRKSHEPHRYGSSPRGRIACAIDWELAQRFRAT
jgi:hypothetical protein